MQLHEIKKPNKQKTGTRKGRGGKRGTYSGRGMKGQNSRAGSSRRPAWRDMLKSLPKRRGYRFAPVSLKVFAINLGALEKGFNDGDVVNFAKLEEKKLIPLRKSGKETIKILGFGQLTKKLTVEKLAISASAAKKIEKAGGKVVN